MTYLLVILKPFNSLSLEAPVYTRGRYELMIAKREHIYNVYATLYFTGYYSKSDSHYVHRMNPLTAENFFTAYLLVTNHTIRR